MKNNINNYWGVAPDKGSLTGPILAPLNSSELHDLHNGSASTAGINARQNSDGFWLSSLGSAGTVSTSWKPVVNGHNLGTSWSER
jgi:glucan 1,3-beta-glucosidase